MRAADSGTTRWGWLGRERTLHVIFLGLAAYLLIGLVRPKNISGMHPDSFWMNSMRWSQCADLVLGGDSRTYVSVSPASMERRLPSLRILNFGFDNAGFSGEYLAGLEDVLDPRSARPAIVLGITPHSLTPGTGSGFASRRRSLRNRPLIASRLAGLKTAWFANLTEAVPLDDALLLLTGSPRLPRHQREYHADGWLASRLTPEQPQKGFAVARRWYAKDRVDPSITDGVMTQVRAWSDRGIRVFAFRPPTTDGMVRFEDSLSGFQEGDFIRRFEEAGGRWLPMDRTRYHTYDSSHLDRDAAVTFSDDLARAIGAQEND